MTRLRWFGASALSVLKGIPATASARLTLLLVVTLAVAAGVWFLHRFDPLLEEIARAQQDPNFVRLGQFLSRWGELHMAPLLALVTIACVGFKRNVTQLVWAALAGLLSGCIAGILVNIIKVIVGRPRPFTNLADGINWMTFGGDHASFPSGHATHCFAIVAGVAFFAPRSAVALALGSLAICWSRWYLLRHYVTDIAAGAWLGIAVGLIIGLAARRAWERSASGGVAEAKPKTANG